MAADSTILASLQTREAALATAIAALGTEISTSLDGETVRHDEHRLSLLKELMEVRKAITTYAGPWEVTTEGTT